MTSSCGIGQFYPHTSGLPHLYWHNRMITLVPVKYSWRMWVNTSWKYSTCWELGGLNIKIPFIGILIIKIRRSYHFYDGNLHDMKDGLYIETGFENMCNVNKTKGYANFMGFSCNFRLPMAAIFTEGINRWISFYLTALGVEHGCLAKYSLFCFIFYLFLTWLAVVSPLPPDARVSAATMDRSVLAPYRCQVDSPVHVNLRSNCPCYRPGVLLTSRVDDSARWWDKLVVFLGNTDDEIKEVLLTAP